MSSTGASGYRWLGPLTEVPESAWERAASATHGRYTAEDLRECAARGEVLAIGIGEGIVVLSICQFPRKRVAYFLAAGGTLPADPRGAFEELCDFLRRGFGVQQLDLIGRPGWGRTLGLDETGCQYVVELES